MTFFPQFIAGFLGMPRRYHYYAQEYQIWHLASTLGASVLGVAFFIPVCYLTYSLIYGPKAGSNPWNAVGLEWTIQSPPITHNFHEIPVVTWEAYEYYKEDHGHGDGHSTESSFPMITEEVHS
jgi:cytochrome c oxidase subunit 1